MKVYLSYARPDLDWAQKLVDGLRDSGHEIWFDYDQLAAGLEWAKKIQMALDTCKAMIVLVSPASMESKEVRREIDHAFLSKNFAHRVLPVYLKPTRDVPWFFGKLSGVQVGKDPIDAIDEIKVALDRFADQEEQ